MRSLFDEEEELFRRSPVLLPAAKVVDSPGPLYIAPSSADLLQGRNQKPSSTTGKKRTTSEVIQRGQSLTSTSRALGQTYLPFRPYDYLFRGVFVGLVLLDPLDRIE